jgi:hypothetical protein
VRWWAEAVADCQARAGRDSPPRVPRVVSRAGVARAACLRGFPRACLLRAMGEVRSGVEEAHRVEEGVDSHSVEGEGRCVVGVAVCSREAVAASDWVEEERRALRLAGYCAHCRGCCEHCRCCARRREVSWGPYPSPYLW